MGQTLQFWTTGEDFTNLLNDFFKEGKFGAIQGVFETGGVGKEALRAFFEGRGHFEGRANLGEDLSYMISKEIPDNFDERLYWAIVNCLALDNSLSPFVTYDEDYPADIDFINEDYWKESRGLQILRSVLPEQYVDMVIRKFIHNQKIKILNSYYHVNPKTLDENRSLSGVILSTGELVVCRYMGHQELFSLLYKLNLVGDPDWTDDKTSFHISSGEVSGHLANSLRHPDVFDDGEMANDKMLNTIIRYKSHIRSVYSEFQTIIRAIQKFNDEVEGHGGKYNNLRFLQKYYPEILLPKFSKDKMELENQCIRTSPKHSLPGLLNSKFELNENSIAEIKSDFEKYKDLRKGNELYFFYQEFIQGSNGVCHFIDDKFTYSLSSNQGDIVKGKRGNKKLTAPSLKKLQEVVSMLGQDLNHPIQIEFVVDANKQVYIVQLRLLQNNYENTVIASKPEKILFTGITFSKGDIECNVDEVLIVSEDAESEALIGKKALIVTSDIEFSHILALSKALRIPAIYATGELGELPKKIKIRAYNKEGYICKL